MPADDRRRRRWPWALGGLVLLACVGTVVVWITSNKAGPVSLRQAESRLGSSGAVAPGAGRPLPGVYEYAGSGTEQLSLPPLSQAEASFMPGTVTLRGSSCWVFRIDYSTHHWQSWQYCLHGEDVWESGGQTWQAWSVGPFQFTNLSTFECAPRSMAVPSAASPGELWDSRCTGVNTSVGGRTVSAGPYRFVGLQTMSIGGERILAAHFSRRRTDSGAQRGTERSEEWFDASNGLPLRLDQDIEVTTSTPFGTSTYKQRGTLLLKSLAPHR